MTSVKLADRPTDFHLERREQRGGSLRLVVMRTPLHLARSHRQEGCVRSSASDAGRAGAVEGSRSNPASDVAHGAPWSRHVVFGAPLTLRGQDYASLTKQVEDAVKAL